MEVMLSQPELNILNARTVRFDSLINMAIYQCMWVSAIPNKKSTLENKPYIPAWGMHILVKAWKAVYLKFECTIMHCSTDVCGFFNEHGLFANSETCFLDLPKKKGNLSSV